MMKDITGGPKVPAKPIGGLIAASSAVPVSTFVISSPFARPTVLRVLHPLGFTSVQPVSSRLVSLAEAPAAPLFNFPSPPHELHSISKVTPLIVQLRKGLVPPPRFANRKAVCPNSSSLTYDFDPPSVV